MSDVTREEFENLTRRVAFLEEKEERRAMIARAFSAQSEESALRREAQQSGQPEKSLPIARST